MDFFEITGEDISNLSDGELRTIVGLLCEAEFRRAGFPLSDITWGGKQDAKDGGLDVIIRSNRVLSSVGFIPKSHTGFQVKKPDMKPAAIKKEMKPHGILRDSIKKLINAHGAYVIVSAGSVTDISFERRINAMREAVSGQRGNKNLIVDFIDCSRLATWVRSHPSVIIWLRNKTRRPLRGWQSFESWSEKAGQYITNEGLVLRHASDSNSNDMNSMDGIEKFRGLLREPRVSLRLTGLSGVGKTRFAQALFENIGQNPLNSSLVIYTDMSNGPLPDPGLLTEQLKARGAQAILIIDNCPPALHRQLTTLCSSEDSKLSLLTIEYDVRDDLPEETDVFIMEPSGEKMIQELIEKRFPEIGLVNSRIVADLSGGNARVAIALAKTVRKGESSSSLRDNDLFLRLFEQKNSGDETLLTVAEVCSLLYSFEGTKTDESSEIAFLGKLINVSPEILFKKVVELKRRNLVQSRDVWRAILPHAIANKLAKKALESIPLSNILNSFDNSTERLLNSFSRRLGYLHDCEQAIQIVKDWLKPDGWLGTTSGNLNRFGMKILLNIAPVAPESIIDFIGRAANGESGEEYTSRKNSNFYELIELLRLIAYDPAHFERSTKLICRFALTEHPNENRNSIRNQLGKLFQIHLSGTHATVQQRSQLIGNLLSSSNSNEQELGIFLLDKALQTGHFSGADYSFGARSRDFGFRPRTAQEYSYWFRIFVEICSSLASSTGVLRNRTRALLGRNFRGLWRAHLFDLMDRTARVIHETGPWNEGWAGIKNALRFDSKHYNEEIIVRLKTLEILLRPSSLIDRARTIALTNRHDIFEFENTGDNDKDIMKSWENMHQQAREIGRAVIQDSRVFSELLPELLSTSNERLFSFGEGIGESTEDLPGVWMKLYHAVEDIPREQLTYSLILGFLKSCSRKNQIFLQETLDSMVDDRLFRSMFPIFQASLVIDIRGVERLKKSLSIGLTDIRVYRSIEYASFSESVSENLYISLLLGLLSKENGILVVIETLYWKLRSQRENQISHSPLLLEFASTVLVSYPFAGNLWESNDHSLAFLVEECFKDNYQSALQVCSNMKIAIQNYEFHYDYRGFLRSLSAVQPFAFLNTFVRQKGTEENDFGVLTVASNPFDFIAETDIEAWCYANVERIPNLLTDFTPFVREHNKLVWKGIIFKLLDLAPDLTAALQPLRVSVHQINLHDDLQNNLEERLSLLKDLKQNENTGIHNWIKAMEVEIQQRFEYERETEKQRMKLRNESFE